MDTKISIQELAQFLSEKNGLSRKDAENFVRDFFETVSQKVLEDKLVKIKGFGTFKLFEVLDRESINVNTGERFVIPGHSKISFTPDTALKDTVNKPFADFQPVVINDRTSVEEMEKIDLPEQEIETDELTDEELVAAPDETLTTTIPVAAAETPEETTSLAVEASALQSDESAPEPLEAPVTEPVSEPVEEPVPDPYSAPLPVPEPVEEHAMEGSARQFAIEETNEPIPVPMEKESATEPVYEEKTAKPVESRVAEAKAPGQVKEVVRETVVERTLPVSFWKVLGYSLLAIGLMLLSYLAGYYKWLCPCNFIDDCAQVEQVQTPVVRQKPAVIVKKPQPKPVVQKKDTVRTDSTAVWKAKYKQVPGGTYLITGTRKTRVLKSGDYLSKISREEYGSKDFMPYIIAHNQFPNPDNIPIGYKVKIPELRKK